MAARGVELWIALLRATRANPSPWPADSVERTIRDTFGLTSLASLARLNPHSCFSKTCRAISPLGLKPSSLIFEEWTSLLRADSLARRKSALRTSGSGCSSWPTAKTSRGEYSYSRGDATQPVLNLEGAVKEWGTPISNERAHAPREVDHGVQLANQVNLWQTAIPPDSPKTRKQVGATEREDLLPSQAEKWQTPQQPKGGGTGRSGDRIDEPLLDGQARQWRTPNSHIIEAKKGNIKLEGRTPADPQVGLADQTKQWSMASARDWRDGAASDETMEKNARPLNEVACHSSLPAPPTSTDGDECLNSGQTSPQPSKRRLNPAFVEFLMGWPPAWSVARSGCGCSATELSLYRRRMRSCLYGLVSSRSELDG